MAAFGTEFTHEYFFKCLEFCTLNERTIYLLQYTNQEIALEADRPIDTIDGHARDNK